MRRFAVGLLIVLSALCLLLSSLSLWTRHNVVNTQVFVSNTEAMIHEPAVTKRVTDAVTTQVMANPDVQSAINSAVSALPPGLQRFRPSVEDGVRSLVATGVGRVLTSDAFTNLTTAALTSAHTQLVDGQPVRFTLGQAKAFVPPGSGGGLASQVLALVPDNIGITVVTPADAPRLYNAIDLLKSLWLWVGLVSLALLGGALWVSHRRRHTLRAWSVTLSVLVLMVLATLRLIRGPLLAQVKPVNRDAVSAIWDVIAGSLRSWNLWLLAIGLLVLVETLVWGHLGLVAGVRRGVRSVQEQAQRRRDARQAARALPAAEQADGAAPGAEPVPVLAPTAAEPWFGRMVDDGRAFVEGMELDRRVAGLSVFVRAHLQPARWTGAVIAALVLLFWPSPTLRVLIWVAALTALYLGALEWLQSRAPAVVDDVQPAADELAPAAGADVVPLVPGPVGATAINGQPARDAGQAVPAAVPVDGIPAPRDEKHPMAKEQLGDLSERLDLIVRLGAARDSGVLTEDEFAREKARVMPSA